MSRSRIEQDLEKIQIEKNWLKEGREVCHRDNLDQKMYIEDLLKQIRERPTADDPLKKEKTTMLLGVLCHWWDQSGEFKKAKFHRDELVPIEVAELGYIGVLAYYEKLNNLRS